MKKPVILTLAATVAIASITLYSVAATAPAQSSPMMQSQGAPVESPPQWTQRGGPMMQPPPFGPPPQHMQAHRMPSHMPRPPRPHFSKERLLELEVQEEDIRAVQMLQYSNNLHRITLEADVATAHCELNYLLQDDNTDDAAVGSVIDALFDARKKLFHSDILTRRAIGKILGDDVIHEYREQSDRPCRGPRNQ